jgi:hypothetical protein
MWKRRVVRIVSVTLAVLIGVPALGVFGLVLWDGGIDTDPRRAILRDVRIDLRTAMTRLGPIASRTS